MLDAASILFDPAIDAGRHYLSRDLYAVATFLLAADRVWRGRKLERRVEQLEQERSRKEMFPLESRSISGSTFGQRTWYTVGLKRHVGTDYKAYNAVVRAPFDGTVTRTGYGQDGGNTLVFVPDHDQVVMRFLHLSKFLVTGGRVAKGTPIAVTGNTGRLTAGHHLHLDISRGVVDLTKPFPSNFIDPEQYAWEPVTFIPVSSPPTEPERVTFAPFTTNLAPSQSYRHEVERVQRFLVALGHMAPPNGEWGYYGNDTQRAVNAFQKAQGITAGANYYGWWYEKTREAANRLAATTYQN